jgi:anti-sigma factor RsiW
MSPMIVTEAELHAYIDGELTQTRRQEVQAYLAQHPDIGLRVQAYEHDKRALRQWFDPVLTQVVPDPLRRLTQAPPGKSSKQVAWLSRWSLQRVAAGFAIAILSGSVGWLAHGHVATKPILAERSALPHQAAVAHAVFSPDARRPVEISAAQEDQLVTWLSKRLGTKIKVPKLGLLGYELIGGRLLPGSSGPVAQFMYHDASDQRLTLYVSMDMADQQDTAFRFAQEGAVNVFYWVDGKFGYALSAGLPKDELARVSRAVYEQLDQP